MKDVFTKLKNIICSLKKSIMRRITIFNLSFKQVFFRFYLMMAVVIGFGFLNQFTIAAILGYIAAIGFILGVGFEKPDARAASMKEKIVTPEKRHRKIAKAA
jgi:hypothetical protein